MRGSGSKDRAGAHARCAGRRVGRGTIERRSSTAIGTRRGERDKQAVAVADLEKGKNFGPPGLAGALAIGE